MGRGGPLWASSPRPYQLEGTSAGLGALDCNDLEKVCNRPLGDMDQLA
jgi:hypothetical protein